MRSIKLAIILGVLAVTLVILTIFVVNSGNSEHGLYVSKVSGDVSVTTKDNITSPAAPETFLSEGAIITVNADSTCTLIYRTSDNIDENYIVLEPATQVFVTNEFDGKNNGELYLNRGSALISAIEKTKNDVIIRTENASFTTESAALKIAYSVGEQTYSEIASFGGASQIQLFDTMGNPVDKDGNKGGEPVFLGSGLSGKVISGQSNPTFDYLNIPTDLSKQSRYTLQELITAAAFHDLAFSTQDFKNAYDAAGTLTEQPAQTESAATETAVSDTELTTAPIETTVPETVTNDETTTTTTAPPQTQATTTTPYTTTTRATTTTPHVTVVTKPQTTTTTADTRTFPVYIIVEDEIYAQEVPYGQNAEEPAAPYVEGKKFIGWDESFTNITGERTITAIFEDITPAQTTTATSVTFAENYKVTISINGQTTTQTVPHGGTAQLPTVNVAGYSFLGWDKSADNITSDTVITAILVPADSVWQTTAATTNAPIYVVTFVVDGIEYPVTVSGGNNATPPVTPTFNNQGQPFVGWSRSLDNVTGSYYVEAIFAN